MNQRLKKITFCDSVIFYVSKNNSRIYKIEVNTLKIASRLKNNNFQFGHAIYNLIINSLSTYHFSKLNSSHHCTEIQLMYLRDNWVKLVYQPLGGATSSDTGQ